MTDRKHFPNVPSPYDLGGIKQASQRPELIRMVTLSYNLGVGTKQSSNSSKPRTKKK